MREIEIFCCVMLHATVNPIFHDTAASFSIVVDSSIAVRSFRTSDHLENQISPEDVPYYSGQNVGNSQKLRCYIWKNPNGGRFHLQII